MNDTDSTNEPEATLVVRNYALAALLLGIAAWVIPFFGVAAAIAAVVLGSITRSDCEKAIGEGMKPVSAIGTPVSKAMGQWGMALGIIAIFVYIVILFIWAGGLEAEGMVSASTS